MDDFWKAIAVSFTAVGAYIAYQQFRLGREKLKLDLFEKRFAVFDGLRRFLSEIMRDGKMEYPQLFAYRASTAETSFLFGDDIIAYIDEIDKRALKMKGLGMSWKEESSEVKRIAQIQAESDELGWLIDQLPLLKVKFAIYMKFQTWS